MTKRILSVQIPETLWSSLDELARRSGRKKNLIVGASLYSFLSINKSDQEQFIQQYLNAHEK